MNGPPLARVAFFVRLNESLQPNEYELPLDVRFDDVVTDVGHNYDRLNVRYCTALHFHSFIHSGHELLCSLHSHVLHVTSLSFLRMN